MKIELAQLKRKFQDGVLIKIIPAFRELDDGDLLAVTSDDSNFGTELKKWSQLTGHPIVEVTTIRNGVDRFVIRKGTAQTYDVSHRLGTRLWIYTNFDCNLSCDYCCARSSPYAPRSALGVDEVRRLVAEATALGFKEVFMTGGEPFLLPNISEIIKTSAALLPTTVLTNGMLFFGPRLAALNSLPRDSVTLQISLDSPTPELHDMHRGKGSWAKAWDGITTSRKMGFRVRVAATASSQQQLAEMDGFLAAHNIPPEDRVLRLVALRGNAKSGIVLARPELVPELTVTNQGVYWHPVGATDDDFLISRQIFPLSTALQTAHHILQSDNSAQERLAQIFNCA